VLSALAFRAREVPVATVVADEGGCCERSDASESHDAVTRAEANTTHAVPTRSLDPDRRTRGAVRKGRPVAAFHAPGASPVGVVSRGRPTRSREAPLGRIDISFVVVETDSNPYKTMI
jgi:hypothetical protein